MPVILYGIQVDGVVAVAIRNAGADHTGAVADGDRAVRFSRAGDLVPGGIEGDGWLAWRDRVDDKVNLLGQPALVTGGVNFTHGDGVGAFRQRAVRRYAPQPVRADGDSAHFHAVIVNNNRTARIATAREPRLAGVGGLACCNRTAYGADFIVHHKGRWRGGRSHIDINRKAR
ncbi:hypothetical protein D3C72_1001150 [compost metagenome]